MTRILIGIGAMAAILLTGLVHGYWTERWTARGGTAQAAERMSQISGELGDWRGAPMDAAPTQSDGLAGYVYRRYVHRQTGQTIVMALFCGRAGPISIHTPDVCYAGSGYEVGVPATHTIPARDGVRAAEFRTAQFLKTSASDRSQLRIFWSWNADGGWTVPASPRFAFAHRPFLYKLYLIRETTEANESLEGDPCLDLMGRLLPEMQRCLFPSS